MSRWPSGTRQGSLDLASFVAQLLTPNVTAPLPEPWHGPYSEHRAAAWIKDRDDEGTALLVVERATGNPMGLVLLHVSPEIRKPDSELRLGYLLAESYWGRGFATELLGGFVEWARTASYRRVVAGVASDNAASRRVLEKSGFTRKREATGSEDLYVILV